MTTEARERLAALLTRMRRAHLNPLIPSRKDTRND